MVTFLRAEGLRVVIFLNDHKPAHGHVFGDGEAKIGLAGVDGFPNVVWADGMSRGELRRAIRIVQENFLLLAKRWEEIHG